MGNVEERRNEPMVSMDKSRKRHLSSIEKAKLLETLCTVTSIIHLKLILE